ncbi:centrosomal protein of 162 kDa [Malaya genurostris]|uniref:centrosomal protein of 162 kDa n=1 Tax=Malaya genurostris TaxID=325434 RepID=UPI0026F3C610|nr:centrosomal protein of 162 kDa [Malaya genurostris]XP_058445494.1 centrosomal protein of 162 kDa [Malaya genurostris]
MSLRQQEQLAAASPEMGGSSAMEKLLEAQQQQLDDITSESSFLEFLRIEQSCLAAVLSGSCSSRPVDGNQSKEDVDVDRIFEQVSQLAGTGEDTRSVEEILHEAEQLIRKQPVFGELENGSCGFPAEKMETSVPKNDISCESTTMEFNGNVSREQEILTIGLTQEIAQLNLQDTEASPVQVSNLFRRRSFVISTTEQQDDHTYRRPHSDQICPVPLSEPVAAQTEMRTKKNGSNVATGKSSLGTNGKATTPKKRTNGGKTAATGSRRSTEDNKENLQLSHARIKDLEEIYNKTLNESSSSVSTITCEKTFCDKSTAPSPTRTVTPIITDSFSWTKERELESNITELQEKLKDTKERYESLKIQYDTLSQVHRTLRENHGPVQEENDKLKLDVQHLTECANVLRSELQSARSDRDSALDLQKILQTELEESRREKKRYQDVNEKDSKTIQDLQRQCREMERILMRKHPDSVSALIVASKQSPTSKQPDDASQTRRLLEQRIAQLESDAKEQDAKAQGILANVQARFNSVQAKYETHIADLEMQVLSLQEINSKLNEKIIRQIDELSSITSHSASSLPRVVAATNNSFTQTEDFPEKECIKTRSISVQTDSKLTGVGVAGGRTQSAVGTKRASSANVGSKIPNSLSDSHIQSREDAHLLATIRGMRVDLAIKEKAVQRLTREVEDCKKTIKKLQKERDAYLKPDGKPSIATTKGKHYDPSQFTDGGATGENGTLKDAHLKIKLLEADYKTLHDKRLQDLKTLQAAHERELAACHETVRILQQRLTEKEEHSHTKEKRRPNHNIDYFALKAKVSSLERRHTEREQRLHMLVEALSKGGRLNGVHIRALAAASAATADNVATTTSTTARIGDVEHHSPTIGNNRTITVNAHQNKNATAVGGNL